MTSDNGSKELFKRQQYGRQSLDSSEKNIEQRRMIWRLRKSEIGSKSEENLTDNKRKVNKMNENITRFSQLSNSFEHMDNSRRRSSETSETDPRMTAKSCDNINQGCLSVRAMSYPGPPPLPPRGETLRPTSHQSFAPVSVGITTKRPSPHIQKTALTMEPVSPSHHLHSSKAPRPFTSVNIMLRPPSSEPQSPIDIIMHGSSITYSTSDPKLGYESLEINFRPGGQTSAMKSLPNENTNPSTQLVIAEQRKRIQILEEMFNSDLKILQKLDEEIGRMKQYLLHRQSIPNKLDKIKEEIIPLRRECAMYTSQVDRASNEQVPLGETNEDYYKHIYHESDSSLVWRNQNVSAQSQNTEEVGWQCHMCTFINYPVLPKCEQCEMPRLDFESSIIASSNNRTTAMKSTAMS